MIRDVLAGAGAVLIGSVVALVVRAATHRRQHRCFHHSPHDGMSFLRSELVDLGRRKLWECQSCGKRWAR